MNPIDKLLTNNKAWARARVDEDPEFFTRLMKLQAPEFLWIGCSDSRVPANEITGTHPGEIFVQRNVANLVVNTDLNLGTVLEYAVRVLKVKHVIVCGHYGCGGIRASMSKTSMGAINKWLRHIKDVYFVHKTQLDAIADENKRADRLTELNVIEQVHNLTKSSVIQKAWKEEQRPHLHGWVYGLQNGIINPVINIAPGTHIDDIYEFEDL